MNVIRHRTRLGKALVAVVAAVAVLGVAGFAAYKYLFNRAGEAAVSLIPSDADMVFTVDSTPSERQLVTFKKISDALKAEGLLDKMEEGIGGMLDGSPAAKEIRPYITHSYAMGMWMPNKESEPEMLVLMAISDPGKVRSILAKHGAKSADGAAEAYSFSEGSVSAAVVQNYLAMSPKPAYLARAQRVSEGAEQSVANLAEYRSARSQLAPDSNFMLFLAPGAMAKMEDLAEGTGMGMYASAQWMSFGIAVGPQGLEMKYQCPYNPERIPALKAIAGIKPVSGDVLKKLPEGAYGVMAYSSASKYWQFFNEAAASEKDTKKTIDEGVAEFEKETGLNIQRDILPAFDGDFVVAAYPAPGNEEKSVDLVLLLDDANGAKPAGLTQKLRAMVEEKSKESGDPVRFEVREDGDARIYTLDAESQKALEQGFASAPQPTDFEYAPPPAAQMPDDAVTPSPQPAPQDDFMKGKSFVYAEVGQNVVIASSQAMLNRTLETMRGGGKSLSSDPSFAGMAAEMDKNAQGYLLVDVKRILERLRPMMQEGMEGAPVSADDIIAMFGESGSGVIATGRYDGNVAVGDMFLPMNYERVIKVMAAALKETEQSFENLEAEPPGEPEWSSEGEAILR